MKYFFTGIILCSIFATCKKETILIETENIAPIELYGTWELINGDTNIPIQFYTFNKESKMCSYWVEMLKGYRYTLTTPFRANKNELNIGSGKYKYKIENSELILYNDDTTFSTYKKNTIINKIPDNWIKTPLIVNSIEVPLIFYSRNIGIEGNYLYYCTNLRDSFVFKHNLITNKIEDSMAIKSSRCSNFFYNGYLYHGDYDAGKLYKTLNFKKQSKQYISNTNYNNISSLSINPQTNDIYILSEDRDIFIGKENNDFNKLEIDNYPNYFTYYKNDEFLMGHNDDMIYKLTPSNKYKVIENYKIVGYTIYNVSTNGDDIWVTAIKKSDSKRFLLKINLP